MQKQLRFIVFLARGTPRKFQGRNAYKTLGILSQKSHSGPKWHPGPPLYIAMLVYLAPARGTFLSCREVFPGRKPFFLPAGKSASHG